MEGYNSMMSSYPKQLVKRLQGCLYKNDFGGFEAVSGFIKNWRKSSIFPIKEVP
ncbi:hypothetical protein H5410_008308 [Solanum commersonii]|uniref:Uncharacterized protein n=1 Tax=Solanum commersonii TaxID=4109 RepID=A0A9J6AG68_SOLCO|nr:hypothetical protein H5410_008308 [Solanum commersonii]